MHPVRADFVVVNTFTWDGNCLGRVVAEYLAKVTSYFLLVILLGQTGWSVRQPSGESFNMQQHCKSMDFGKLTGPE